MAQATEARSLKERQREERERLILEAAEKLLLERGYHETSIDDIAARVGISKGTVYLHFASKEDLVFALLTRGMRAFLQRIDDILSGTGTAREKLATLIEQAYGDMAGQRFQLFSAIFQSPEIHSRLADRRNQMRELWDERQQRIAALLEAGKAEGEFDCDMPTPIMLSLLAGMLSPHGYQRLVVEEHMPGDLVVCHLRRFFFKGIAAGDQTPDEPPDS